ncbi:MAG: N-acetylmuramoyl-L-alanine amidase [Synergistaceae bacterium]|nr:N-acetylmuramoyl-L-alanine amidase [Synergistaceae bacterium]
MRRFFSGAFIAVITLAALIIMMPCAMAHAEIMLFRGQTGVGAVQSIERNSETFVSVEDAGGLLGFAAVRRGEELVLRRGNIQLRLALGSAAGWRGLVIIPMSSAPFEQGGKFWLDTRSAATLFQSTVGQGAGNRLRFGKTESYNVADSGKSEFGEFDETTLTAQNTDTDIDARLGISSSSASDIIIPQNTQTVQQEQKPEIKPEPNPEPKPEIKPEPKPLTASLPQVQQPKSQPENETEIQTVSLPEPKPRPKQAVRAAQKAQKEEHKEQEETQPVVAVVSSAKKSSGSGKSQPRLETFRPDDSRNKKGDDYSGTIQGIRWTTQDEPNKKIRAVILADDESDPVVFMDKGQLHALFSSSLENSAGIASPFAANVKAEIKNNIDGTDLIFTPNGITKAEKLVLNNPRRIVFEFFFPDDTEFIGTSPKKAVTDTQMLPGQVSPESTKTAETKPETPSKPDPVITSDTQYETKGTPVVMTPPSTITIPTSPQASERLRQDLGLPALNISGRKTIVIDPGHGGKDPGAMDNGVKEKDVNLAVGLELQKALTAKGYNAIMTRATDVYLKLQERTDIANNLKADLFVSIHVNALPARKSMTGFEIYIMALPTDKDAMNLAKIENREYVEGKGMDTANVDKKTEMLLHILGDMQQNNKISESTDFAAALYNAGVRNSLPMRRVAQAPFFVLRGAGMPAVLLEIGFVTNANEAQTLITPVYQQRIANAMAEGIANYIR